MQRARARWNRTRTCFFFLKKKKRTHRGTGRSLSTRAPSSVMMVQAPAHWCAGSETREINEVDRAGLGSGPEMVTSFLPEKRICLTTVLLQRFGISASHGKLFELTQRQRILVGLWARPPVLSPARSSHLHVFSPSLPLGALRIFMGRGAMQVGCSGQSQIPSMSHNLRPIRGRIKFPATTNNASTQQHGAARAAAPPNGTSQAADDAVGKPTLGCSTEAGKKKRHAKKKTAPTAPESQEANRRRDVLLRIATRHLPKGHRPRPRSAPNAH